MNSKAPDAFALGGWQDPQSELPLEPPESDWPDWMKTAPLPNAGCPENCAGRSCPACDETLREPPPDGTWKRELARVQPSPADWDANDHFGWHPEKKAQG